MIVFVLIGFLLAVASDGDPVAQPPRPKDTSALMMDNYPAAALRAHAEGRTAIALSIDPSGHITACQVTTTSGNADLDRATCTVFRKLHFYPALDLNGKAVAGEWASSMKWTLPR